MVSASSITNWEQVKNLLGKIKRTPRRVPWWEIRRYAGQPRRVFEAISELGGCLAALGQLDPVKIRPLTTSELDEIRQRVAAGDADECELRFRYEIIDGERRYRAAQEQFPIGTDDEGAVLDCVEYDLDDKKLQFLISVASNFGSQRHQPMEIADAFGRLRDELRMSAAQVARFVSQPYQFVAGMLLLLELHPDVRKLVENGKIGASVGKALARVEKDRQAALLLSVQQSGPVTVSRVKTAVDALLSGTPESRNPSLRKRTRGPRDFREILERSLQRTAIAFGDMTLTAIESAVESGLQRGVLNYDQLVSDGVHAAENLLRVVAAIPADGEGTLEAAVVGVLSQGLAGVLDVPETYWSGLNNQKAASLRFSLESIEQAAAKALAALNNKPPQPETAKRAPQTAPKPPATADAPAHRTPTGGTKRSRPALKPQQTSKKDGLRGGLDGLRRRS